MLKFNNTHIFTGYLKQLLSAFNLPTCKIYTNEFANYFKEHGKEDPRIIESIDSIAKSKEKYRTSARVNYLKHNEIYNYFWPYSETTQNLNYDKVCWKHSATNFYDEEKSTHGLTRVLHSPGNVYDSSTHEYLGEFLRFLRDYHGVNLMPLYNCFSNKICNNIVYENIKGSKVSLNSKDPKYIIYAFPVKLFESYTIAIDCNQSVEMFCGFYKTRLGTSSKEIDLINKTYQKETKPSFKKPFLYNKLEVTNWMLDLNTVQENLTNEGIITRWDIANREQDLHLFLKMPASCRSSITVLEGDYRGFNDCKYTPIAHDDSKFVNDMPEKDKLDVWEYKQNNYVINFNTKKSADGDNINLNTSPFFPIGKLQLLAFNTGESYPFSDRLVEYLSGSAITPIDPISDNIKRAQKVMNNNGHYFMINGLWENKMQKIIYDCINNAGPIDIENGKLSDKRKGYHSKLGHSSKSTLFDILGYIDRDAEKWYANWALNKDGKVIIENIQNVDIYNGLFDI